MSLWKSELPIQSQLEISDPMFKELLDPSQFENTSSDPTDNTGSAMFPCASELPDQNQLKVSPGRDLRVAALIDAKWVPGQTITICFLEGSAFLKTAVTHFSKEWLSYAYLKFKFVPGPVADIRIAFKKGQGSWSHVGTYCRKVEADLPTMNLEFNDYTALSVLKGTTLHEFGHMIGLLHEHNSPNSPILWNLQATYDFYAKSPHFWNKEQVDHNIIKKYTTTQTQYTAFDPLSIMLYNFGAHLSCNNYVTKSNRKLSPTDKEYVGKLYPFPTPSLNFYQIPINTTIKLIKPTKTDGIIIFQSSVINPNASTNNTSITLLGSDGANLLYIGFNSKQDVIVFDSRPTNDTWLAEKRIKFNGSFGGQNISITVYDHGDRYQVLMNGNTKIYYDKQLKGNITAISYGVAVGEAPLFSENIAMQTYDSFGALVPASS